MPASSFGALGASFYIRTFDKNSPITQTDLNDLVRFVELTSTIVAIGPFVPSVSESVWMILERVDVSEADGYVVSETAGVTMDPNGIIKLGSLLDLGIEDGTNGQVLTTDGSGNFSFSTVSTTTVPYINVITGSYTIQLADIGGMVYGSNADISIPDDTTMSADLGSSLTITSGNNLITVQAENVGTSIYLSGNTTPGSWIIPPRTVAKLYKLETEVWYLDGIGIVSL